MTRRLLNLMTAVSLLLLGAVVALWVRSYFVVDEVRWRNRGQRYDVATAAGQVDLSVTDESSIELFPQGWRWRQGPGQVDERLLWRRSVSSPQNPFTRRPVRPQRFGCWWGTQSVRAPEFPTPVVTRYLYFPIWPLALACLALPGSQAVRAVIQNFRGRNVRRGLCRHCGYDLRASPGRCPECGAAAEDTATPPAATPA